MKRCGVTYSYFVTALEFSLLSLVYVCKHTFIDLEQCYICIKVQILSLICSAFQNCNLYEFGAD